MSRGEPKASSLQTSLFDEATLAAAPVRLASRTSVPNPPDQDGRSTAVWRQWLSSMASDAEAALAAAIAYREMDAPGREKWLSSLEFDAPAVDVPQVALYAPLLAVEQDPERRERLLFALEKAPSPPITRSRARALCGASEQDSALRVYIVATPLYLDFVQVLACGVRRGVFEWVRHDPIVGPSGVPSVGERVEGAVLEGAPMKSVLDELASAVLSHQRSGRPLPEALSVLGDFLGLSGP